LGKRHSSCHIGSNKICTYIIGDIVTPKEIWSGRNPTICDLVFLGMKLIVESQKKKERNWIVKA
jgi:hypothetical protein